MKKEEELRIYYDKLNKLIEDEFYSNITETKKDLLELTLFCIIAHAREKCGHFKDSDICEIIDKLKDGTMRFLNC